MGRLRQVLLWRFSRHVWTFENAAALVMFINGMILLTSPYRTGTVPYFNLFLFGVDTIFWIALGMVVNAIAMFFRKLKPSELFLFYLPMWFYGFVLVYVTLVYPKLSWTIVFIWVQPLIFTVFRILGKLIGVPR